MTDVSLRRADASFFSNRCTCAAFVLCVSVPLRASLCLSVPLCAFLCHSVHLCGSTPPCLCASSCLAAPLLPLCAAPCLYILLCASICLSAPLCAALCLYIPLCSSVPPRTSRCPCIYLFPLCHSVLLCRFTTKAVALWNSNGVTMPKANLNNTKFKLYIKQLC